MATKLIALNSNYFLFPETTIPSLKFEAWGPINKTTKYFSQNNAMIPRVLSDRVGSSKEHAYHITANQWRTTLGKISNKFFQEIGTSCAEHGSRSHNNPVLLQLRDKVTGHATVFRLKNLSGEVQRQSSPFPKIAPCRKTLASSLRFAITQFVKFVIYAFQYLTSHHF